MSGHRRRPSELPIGFHEGVFDNPFATGEDSAGAGAAEAKADAGDSVSPLGATKSAVPALDLKKLAIGVHAITGRTSPCSPLRHPVSVRSEGSSGRSSGLGKRLSSQAGDITPPGFPFEGQLSFADRLKAGGQVLSALDRLDGLQPTPAAPPAPPSSPAAAKPDEDRTAPPAMTATLEWSADNSGVVVGRDITVDLS